MERIDYLRKIFRSSLIKLPEFKNPPGTHLADVTENAGSDLIDINLHKPSKYNIYTDASGYYKFIISVNEALKYLSEIQEKDQDFNDAPSGLPGVETLYPIFLYLVSKEIISYQHKED